MSKPAVGEHEHARAVYASLLQRGTAPPLPREYGLRVVSEVLRAHAHLMLLNQPIQLESDQP